MDPIQHRYVPASRVKPVFNPDNAVEVDIIYENGLTHKRLYLDLEDDKQRELIIAGHIAKAMQKQYSLSLPDTLYARDGYLVSGEKAPGYPYDFTYKQGPRELLIELTQLRESERSFIIRKAIGAIDLALNRGGITQDTVVLVPDTVSLKSLPKSYNGPFPLVKSNNHSWLDKQLRATRADGLPRIFRSRKRTGRREWHAFNEGQTLTQMVDIAISRKLKRDYKRVEEVILVLDEGSMITLEEIRQAQPRLSQYYKDSPFHSIYIYSGLYSDGSGASAEFYLTPIKATYDQELQRQLSASHGVDGE